MVDYLIVGSGLAGLSFAHLLEQNNKSFIIFDNHSQNSTSIAAGLYNPVVLKRFTSIWKSKQLLDESIPFYESIQNKLNANFLFHQSLFRVFSSIEEQNMWFESSDKTSLAAFLNPVLMNNPCPSLNAPYKLGEVIGSGYLNTQLYKSISEDYFRKNDLFKDEIFNYLNIIFNTDHYSYKEYDFKKIVFCEGFGVHQNPYFNFLPIDGTKGEIITIRALNLKLNILVSSGIFMIPLGEDLYRVGATYNWLEKNNLPTNEGKNELINQLKNLIKTDFDIISHEAGIRPTVKHRRPILGRNSVHKDFYIFNGLGTRGVILAPYLAKQLYNFIEHDICLDPEIDITKIKKPKI